LSFSDQGTPVPIRSFLKGHTIKTASQQGWEKLENGELLTIAEREGFDVFLTSDKNIQHQQNLKGRRIAIVVLGNPQWPIVRQHVGLVVDAVNAAQPGSYSLIDIPLGT
jgi:hypothetical protein